MAITYGTIGTGWITDSWIHAATKTGKWTLHAVYSRTQEQASAFASKHSCSKIYTSLDGLASDPDLQAVYVASPNNLHHSQTKLLLEHGKHVVVEKPATSTHAELDDLFRTARAHNVFLIEAFRHIQEANFRLLRDLVQRQRRLGTLYGASFQYASYSGRFTALLRGHDGGGGAGLNVFDPAFAGGSLVDVGVYPVAVAVALFGAPESQTYAAFKTATGVDGGGPVLLRYPGFGVQINQSKGYTSTQPCEIWGEKGALRINFVTDIRSVEFEDPRSKEKVELAGEWKAAQKPDVNMEEEAEEFARILGEGDRKAEAELEEISRTVVRITEDLRRQNGIVYPADERR